MLTDQWPELRPVSLPVSHRKPAPTPLLPRSLISLGWQKDPSYKVRHDLLMRAPCSFPQSPPSSPSPPYPDHPALDSAGRLTSLLEVDPEGPTSSEDGDSDTASPSAAKASTPDRPSVSTTTGVDLKFLTINVHKAGANNPSIVNIITMLNQHAPDFLLLTKTPLPPHKGALLHALRTRGYRIHHTLANAPFQPDGLPEARLPKHIVHPGGGC